MVKSNWVNLVKHGQYTSWPPGISAPVSEDLMREVDVDMLLSVQVMHTATMPILGC
jgi:hypothetical protein